MNRLAPWNLDERIVGRGIPSVGQERLAARLRPHGIRLAWHPRREVFVTWRDRGPTTSPLWYPLEMGRSFWPFTHGVSGLILDGVRLADAHAKDDRAAALDVWERRARDVIKREQRDWIEERMPDFMADMHRAYDLLKDGPRASRPVFADLGSPR